MIEGATLSGRAILVVGGASGIGRAIAARLAACGARVVVGDIDLDCASRVPGWWAPRRRARCVRQRVGQAGDQGGDRGGGRARGCLLDRGAGRRAWSGGVLCRQGGDRRPHTCPRRRACRGRDPGELPVPGLVDTPFNDPVWDRAGDRATAETALLATMPLRRQASPDEVARAAVFLLSPDSKYVTGTAFVVDGCLLAVR